MPRLTNVVYTDFEAIDDYIDASKYYYHLGKQSILEDDCSPPPIIIDRSEASLINTSRNAMLQRHKEHLDRLAYWENEQYMFPENRREQLKPTLTKEQETILFFNSLFEPKQ